MFIGHYGAGLAAKKFAVVPDGKIKPPSLGSFFLASQFLDLLWPLLIILGIEKAEIANSGNPFLNLTFSYYPYSHSMITVVFWSLLFGSLYFAFRKNLRNAVILGIVVFSHWILDLISHIPDLQILLGNNYKIGLGLWNSVAFTILIEGGIFLTGTYLYLKSTESINKRGNYIIWSLIIFLSSVYFLNIISPPPPSIEAVAYTGLSQWLIILWAYWADSNRSLIAKALLVNA